MSRSLFQQITKSYEHQSQIENLKSKPYALPLDLTTPLVEYVMERSYLEEISNRTLFVKDSEGKGYQPISWIKVHRIPIHPTQLENYDLISKWQAVLTSLHAWMCKTIFILQRKHGQTSLYIGLKTTSISTGIGMLRSALINCMPGIEAEPIDDITSEDIDCKTKGSVELMETIDSYTIGGAITGIPSFKKNTASKFAQTLDQLAFGIRTEKNEEADFSIIVVADPMPDSAMREIINKYQKVGSDIHSEVKQNISENESKFSSENKSTSISADFGIGKILSTAATVLGGPLLMVASKGATLAASTLLGTNIGISRSYSSTEGVSVSQSIAKEYLNKFAQFTEKLTDMHCARLRKGRNLGFWNVATYIVGYREEDVSTVSGILKSIYSGDETYIEPIRMHLLRNNDVLDTIKSFNLIPIAHPDYINSYTTEKLESIEWHSFGKPFQYLSTPLNTEELALETSLPRKDVPGLRFVRSSVRFANNPGYQINKTELKIGKFIDYGVEQSNNYNINLNALVRHSLVVGSTGCGKTTTCKTILNGVVKEGIPFLIIEPAKDEYVRWAIEQNKRRNKEDQINIYMPGVKNLEIYGVNEGKRAVPPFKLNPFQPAAIEGAHIDLLLRCEQLTALINTSLPNSDVLPVIIDEALFSFLHSIYGNNFTSGEMRQQEDYPKIEKVLPLAKRILEGRGYAQEVASGLSAALETRFKYLTRGKRGAILNVFRSTDYSKLFNKPTVINLSKIGNRKDAALIMSLILLSLYEYRVSAYTFDSKYREKAQKNQLLHLTIIEEAHNVLTKPVYDVSGTGNPQQIVAELFGNIMSEIRSYGEGLMIVDQIPTRLMDDVIRNTNYKIAHRLSSKDDIDALADALGLRIDQKDIIPLLQQGQALISSDKDDAASWIKINKS